MEAAPVLLFVVYSQNLDMVSVFADHYGNCDGIIALIAVQPADGVLHYAFPAFVDDVEAVRPVGIEERLHDFLCLVLAATVVGIAEDGDFEVVGEPCGKPVGVSLLDVFADRDENIGLVTLYGGEALRFCGKRHARKKGGHRKYDVCNLHPVAIFRQSNLANTKPDD